MLRDSNPRRVTGRKNRRVVLNEPQGSYSKAQEEEHVDTKPCYRAAPSAGGNVVADRFSFCPDRPHNLAARCSSRRFRAALRNDQTRSSTVARAAPGRAHETYPSSSR